MTRLFWITSLVVLFAVITLSFVDKDHIETGTAPGEMAPSLIIDGKDMTLAEKDGRTLISFWASYDAGSRRGNARLGKMCMEAGITFQSVCFDTYRSIYEETLRRDGLDEKDAHLEIDGEDSEIYKAYDLDKGFMAILVDQKGIILQKVPFN